MSVHVYFSMSTGLKTPVTVPEGTHARIKRHIAETIAALSPCDGGPLWGRIDPKVTDEVLCEQAQRHNAFVEELWDTFFPAKPHTGPTEQITPEDAQAFWFALRFIEVPIARWTKEHTLQRLAGVYNALRGWEVQGVSLGAKAISIEQASAAVYVVKHLFNLNVGDLDPQAARMWVKRGRKTARLEWLDELRTNPETDVTQRFDWCERCGAVALDAGNINCPRRKCPLKCEEE